MILHAATLPTPPTTHSHHNPQHHIQHDATNLTITHQMETILEERRRAEAAAAAGGGGAAAAAGGSKDD